MVASEKQKNADRKIKHWLENERRIVTYREIAREVGFSVYQAKSVLSQYLESHPSSGVAATYLLTGPLRTSVKLATTQIPSAEPKFAPEGTQRIRIVDMDEMSDDERNSEDGAGDPEAVSGGLWTADDEENGPDGEDAVVGNDEGDAVGGISGKGVEAVKLEKGGQGVARPEEVERWGVVLVQQDALQEKKALFADGKVNVHVYSLSPGPVKDPGQYLVPTLKLRSHPKYRDPGLYGTITGDGAASGSPDADAAGPSGGKAMKDGAMSFSATKAKKEDASKEKEKVKDVQVKKDPTPEPKKDATKSTNSKKLADTEPETKQDPTDSSSASAKPATGGKKTIARGRKSATAKDGDVKEEQDEPPKEPSSSAQRAEDKAAMEAMMGMDMDDEDDEFSSRPAAPAAGGSTSKAKTAAAGGSTSRVPRKRRKVKKSRMETDEKGYMVTKDYWTDESYSGASEADEPEPSKKATATARAKPRTSAASSRQGSVTTDAPASEPKKGAAPSSSGPGGPPKAKPASKPAVSAARGQSTLAGFFKKK